MTSRAAHRAQAALVREAVLGDDDLRRVLDVARERKVDVAAEDRDLRAVDAMLKEAKANWHAFSLTGVKEKADQAFERGTKVKDALRKKLGFN